MLTDPIADMLTRIRNANRALHDSASMPTSKMKEEIARILKDEGYIKDFRVVEATDDKGQPLPYRMLVVELKFARDRRRVITDLKRVSKPARIACLAFSAGSGRRSCPPPSESSRTARPPSAASAAR